MYRVLLIFFFVIVLQADSIKDEIDGIGLVDHLKGEFRVGYINLNDSGSKDSFGVGGHLHFNSKRFNGFGVGVEGYFVDHFGLKNENGDFFDENRDGFALISQYFLDFSNDKFRAKVGRQLLDTPHLDSDDVRMIPNYFEGGIAEVDFKRVVFTIGRVDKMAGWENGVDAKRFVEIPETLFSSIAFSFNNFDLTYWVYDIDDYAFINYFEAKLKTALKSVGVVYSFQLDRVFEKGGSDVDSYLYGLMVEFYFSSGFEMVFAFNEELKRSAVESFGGGPFFTSMIEETIDSLEDSARSYVGQINYQLKGGSLGFAFGRFRSDLKRVEELDLFCDYYIKKNLNISISFAKLSDYSILTLLLRYSF